YSGRGAAPGASSESAAVPQSRQCSSRYAGRSASRASEARAKRKKPTRAPPHARHLVAGALASWAASARCTVTDLIVGRRGPSFQLREGADGGAYAFRRSNVRVDDVMRIAEAGDLPLR